MAAMSWKMTLFVRFTSNSPSRSRLKSPGRNCTASCQPERSTDMCTASCRARVRSTDQAKTLQVGCSFASCFAGALRETRKKQRDVKSDSMAVCPSPSFTPSSVRTDIAKADITLFSPMILYIINTVDSVARPQRRMCRLHLMESPLYVKGLAMLASPRRTSCTPPSPSRSGCWRPSAACFMLDCWTSAVSSETPTCACFRAPTSLVPSPTIIVCEFLLSAKIICSFCWGDTRAKTVTIGASRISCSSETSAKAQPGIHSVWRFVRSLSLSNESGRTLSEWSSSERHSSCVLLATVSPSSVFVVLEAPFASPKIKKLPSAIDTSLATWHAVSG
mmetsp:Transcript_100697/g.285380  ORF Transcript_100697/g.285380 Transcript_100697/m.285380 type:complete len:333 (+) Transcript_100697:506-1504(+)